jgi:hypothetical protein
MISKSGRRFSEEITLVEQDFASKKSHPALDAPT